MTCNQQVIRAASCGETFEMATITKKELMDRIAAAFAARRTAETAKETVA